MRLNKPGNIAWILVLLVAAGNAFAVQPRTAHTFRLAPNEEPPSAALENVAWMAGSWTGTAFGNTFEQVWSTPSAGSMQGMFKLMDGDAVTFYEMLLLTADADGRLSLKVKHFGPDMVAWEDKADFIDFKLVAIEPDAVHFSGISFYRIDADHIDGYIVMRNGDEVREEKLIYTRAAIDR